jgi:hypothetical protein
MRHLASVFTCITTLFAAIYLNPSQDGEGSSQPVRIATNQLFAYQSDHDFGSGVTVDLKVYGSAVAFDEQGKAIRVLSGIANCRVGTIMIQQGHSFLQIDAASAGPIEFDFANIQTGLASVYAAGIFGETDPRELKKLFEGGTTVPGGVIKISPAQGLVWGSVIDATDLVQTVSAIPVR